MAAKKKTVAVADTAINEKLVADISDQEMIDSELLRKLNAKLRQDHGLCLAEMLNYVGMKFGYGVNLRD